MVSQAVPTGPLPPAPEPSDSPNNRMRLVDTSQRRELNRGLGEGFTRSFEMALTPLVFAVGGFWLDRTLGIVPVLTLGLFVLGVVGVFVRAWYGYAHDMAEHEKSAR